MNKGEYWFVSIQGEIKIHKPVYPSKTAIGVHLGVKILRPCPKVVFIKLKIALNCGKTSRAKFEQRLSKKRGTNNFKKLKKIITKLHTKIANIRQYYLHQVSTDISENHALVVLEDLKVANMSESASGTLENPSKMVAPDLA